MDDLRTVALHSSAVKIGWDWACAQEGATVSPGSLTRLSDAPGLAGTCRHVFHTSGQILSTDCEQEKEFIVLFQSVYYW